MLRKENQLEQKKKKIFTDIFLILYIFMFFVLLEKRDIKVEGNYIFSPVFNGSDLQNFN